MNISNMASGVGRSQAYALINQLSVHEPVDWLCKPRRTCSAKSSRYYKRHGTVSLYAAFDIMTGHVIGRITSPTLMAQLFIDNLRAYQADAALRGEVDFARGY
ncbi:hypothetical protein HUS95_24330 [Pseudomonas chlororaphis]|uniref:hypothetical protein n=1 Tax=Pseudomonas chlororaphis TaxID=587753 RepID=UPI001B3305B5|nr:hypothetical protein [Pseudomonas chlororaphis]MBP5058273.1 hypothetical protein [Pseudomonas chlororaphis]